MYYQQLKMKDISIDQKYWDKSLIIKENKQKKVLREFIEAQLKKQSNFPLLVGEFPSINSNRVYSKLAVKS